MFSPESFAAAAEICFYSVVSTGVNSKPDAKTPLGHHHPRGVVFPMAVSSEEGFATLHMDGRLDGCASLLASKEARFSAECASTNALLQERHVDAASHTRVGTPSR